MQTAMFSKSQYASRNPNTPLRALAVQVLSPAGRPPRCRQEDYCRAGFTSEPGYSHAVLRRGR